MEYIEDTQYFDDYALPDVLPPDPRFFFPDYEGNESVAGLGDKSNHDSSHTVHVDIQEYQFQSTNVNHPKDKLRKIKTYVCYTNILDDFSNIFEKEGSTLCIWNRSEKERTK